MKSKLFMVLGLFYVTSSSISAQTESTFKKNELGLGLNNMLINLMGGQEEMATPLVLTYKRLLNKNFAILGAYSYTNDNSQIAGLDGLTQTEPGVEYIFNKSHTLRTGLEYRYLYKSKFYFVGGIQLQSTTGQVSKSYFSTVTYSTSNPQNVLLRETQTDVKQMGLCLHTGFLIPLGKRFMLSTIWRPSMMLAYSKETTTNVQTGVISDNNSNYSEFTSGPLITDVSLFYRF